MIIRYKNLLAVILLFAFFKANAQQLPQYSQYMINDYVINPAVAGKNSYYEALSSNRYQWAGITDAPRTYILSLDGPLKSKNVGLGGYVFTDITGPTRRTGFYGSYAYHIKLNEKLRLSMGLSGGLLQFAVDGSQITLHDAATDPAFSKALQSTLIPDFGFGTYLYSTDHKFYLGISAPQLLQNKLKFFDVATSSLSKLTTHGYITGGYRFDINDDYTIEPATIIQLSDASPIQVDIGARTIYKKMVWLGVSYRTQDAVSAMLGYCYQNYLMISYSYDFVTSDIGKYSTGTHEIVLGIKFNKK